MALDLDLDISNIENNVYTIDLLIFYCENNQIIDIETDKLDLQDHTLSRDDFKEIISDIEVDNYRAKYILEFYIDNDIDNIIDTVHDIHGHVYDNDTDNDKYKYKLNAITKIDDVVFTNLHFLNSLIIVLDKTEKKSRQHIKTNKNRNVNNTTKKITLK